GATPFVVDNGSYDGTPKWCFEAGGGCVEFPHNIGVSAGWNQGLENLFGYGGQHVLVVGNETIFGPWAYRWLLFFNQPFITGVAVDKMEALREPHETYYGLDPHPDFSCFLIRRECWEKVGPFDESMKLYASDCDYHVRAHKAGVPLYKVCVPFYHERS